MGLAFFLGCIAILVIGYFVYGSFVEKIFGIDEKRPTPAITCEDGVDFVQMPTWKVYLIQLLNIAGLGPIFGPIVGALYGPVALLWIVFGCILGGAVHDFMSGMMSVRKNCESLPEIVGDLLGMPARQAMRLFSLVLLIVVGAVFVIAPSGLIHKLLPLEWKESISVTTIMVCVFVYYAIATIVPIDKIIGKIYPLFGALLLIMTFGVAGGLIVGGYDILPTLDFTTNLHPKGSLVWPGLFIVISCAAISGFHATQSPMMARCIKSEKEGRKIFYGAMIIEGIIGIIWCTASLSFYKTPELLAEAGKAGAVFEISNTLLGGVGGALAILGVIILPITSGDTAFRSARLILAEAFKVKQEIISKRLMVAAPLFGIGIYLSCIGIKGFDILWRFFGLSNQALSTLVLWTGAVYLAKKGKFHWICSLPAVFMTAVTITFLCYYPKALGMAHDLSSYIGIGVAIVSFIAFITLVKKSEEDVDVKVEGEIAFDEMPTIKVERED